MKEKIEILEQVGDSELVVGEVYADKHKSTFLRFVGYSPFENPLFEYYSGQDIYIKTDGRSAFYKTTTTTFYKTKITKE